MRILMVAQFFAPTIGGEERMVESLSVELSRRGHHVSVATLRHDGLPEQEMHRGVRVHRITSAAQRLHRGYREPGRPHAIPAPDPGTVRHLLAIIRREHPDVVHGHNWLAHSFLPLKRLSEVGLVLSLHDYSLVCATKRYLHRDRPCSGPALGKCMACSAAHYGPAKGVPIAVGLRAMASVAASRVDMFLPVSRSVAERSGLPEARLPYEVLPNFLPDDVVIAADGARPPDGLPPDGYTLLVGDLSTDKGVDVLLEAYAGLKDAPPLVLIGRPYSPRLAALPRNVRMHGPRPHAQVMAAWRRCGIAVVPSTCPETFGLAALEAMAVGRPVVAARNGGLADLVADGETGLLVPPGDAAALRGALARLLGDADLRARMGAAAQRRAARFTPGAVLPRLEAIYERVARRRREGIRGAKDAR